jgi:hypothetical protein
MNNSEKIEQYKVLRRICFKMYWEADAEYKESGCIADMGKASGIFKVLQHLNEKIEDLTEPEDLT